MTETSYSLYFRGAGGEFAYHRLNKEEANDVRTNHVSDYEGNSALDPRESYSQTIFELHYSLNPLDMEIRDEQTGEQLDLSQIEFVKDQHVSDFPGDNAAPIQNVLDYVHITKGKVFGAVGINHVSEGDFDPQKLSIHYMEFSLEGYPEEHGALITAIKYDGQDVSNIEFEDNEGELEMFLLGYEFDDNNELVDHVIVYGPKFGQTDFNFDALEKIFSA